jgi:putative copper resistance protein D
MTASVTAAPRTGGQAPLGVVRPSRLLAVATALAVGVALLLLWVGDGRPAAALDGLPDPGPGTAWGLPVARVVADLAAVLTVGLLLLGAVLVPAREGELRGERLRWTRAARWSAVVWAVSVLVLAVLTLSDVLATPVSEVLDPTLLWSFLVDIDLGRALLVQAVLALAVAVGAGLVTTTTGAGLAGLLAVAALVPPTLTGHAGTSTEHTVAVTSLMVHVVGIALWCGGVVALVLLGTSDRRSYPIAVPRFSSLALWCGVAVAASGVVSSALRLASPSELVTSWYGRLVVLKVLLIGVISAFGVWHRRRHLPRLATEPTRLLFLRVAAAEVLVMAATIGVAVALSRTPPPVTGDAPLESLSPARLLLGFDLPPAPTIPGMLWDEARLDGFWFTVVVLLGALYAVGLRTLRRSGDAWSWGRTISWYSGLALLLVTTNAGLATYSHVMFSAHMVQHMLLSMVIPIFLVLAAPVTLALRTLPRNPGQVGPREWLNSFIHSGYVQVISNPIVASLIFVGSFYGLYFSPLFPWLMRSHWGHVFMGVHFLLAGGLFFWSLIGVDPGPKRPPFLARMVIMLVVMPLHSFFSIALMTTSTVLAEEYYGGLLRPYATDLLDDQHLGAAIGWATGEVPMLIVMAAMFIQWMRADERDAKRLDRRQERAAATGQGTDELADYNAYLASLAERDKRGSTR